MLAKRSAQRGLGSGEQPVLGFIAHHAREAEAQRAVRVRIQRPVSQRAPHLEVRGRDARLDAAFRLAQTLEVFELLRERAREREHWIRVLCFTQLSGVEGGAHESRVREARALELLLQDRGQPPWVRLGGDAVAQARDREGRGQLACA
jgi:hypothetical protein